MQGAKISKIMLPCRRRVHLQKSDSAKTIFEQIQKEIKMMLKMIPNWSKRQLKIIQTNAGKHRKLSSKIRQTFKLWFPFWSQLRDWFQGWRVLFSRPAFRNLWGYPHWTDFGLPWDTLGPMLSLVWKIWVATLLQNSKIPGKQMSPTTPSKKQARISNKLYR